MADSIEYLRAELEVAIAELTKAGGEFERFARHVLVTVKHREGCTPATCAKCEAERLLGLR